MGGCREGGSLRARAGRAVALARVVGVRDAFRQILSTMFSLPPPNLLLLRETLLHCFLTAELFRRAGSPAWAGLASREAFHRGALLSSQRATAEVEQDRTGGLVADLRSNRLRHASCNCVAVLNVPAGAAITLGLLSSLPGGSAAVHLRWPGRSRLETSSTASHLLVELRSPRLRFRLCSSARCLRSLPAVFAGFLRKRACEPSRIARLVSNSFSPLGAFPASVLWGAWEQPRPSLFVRPRISPTWSASPFHLSGATQLYKTGVCLQTCRHRVPVPGRRTSLANLVPFSSQELEQLCWIFFY